MAQTHEWVFYELMWRAKSGGEAWPLPWWVQQYFRHWVDIYDNGLFPSKEAAFAANAYYRYCIEHFFLLVIKEMLLYSTDRFRNFFFCCT